MKYKKLFTVLLLCALTSLNYGVNGNVYAESVDEDVRQVETNLLTSNPFFDYDSISGTLYNLPYSTTVENFGEYFAVDVNYSFYSKNSEKLTGKVSSGDSLVIKTEMGEIVTHVGSVDKPKIVAFAYQGTNYSLPLNIVGLISNTYVTAGFDGDNEFPSYSGHKGIDFSYGGIYGTSVYSVERGTVVKTNNTCMANNSSTCGSGWGDYVRISHPDGTETLYAHLSAVNVSLNASLNKSAIIGKVGSTGNSSGPHLHFEVYKGGVRVNPKEYLRNAPLPNKQGVAYIMPYELNGKASFALFTSNGVNGFDEGIGSSSVTYSLVRDSNNQAVGRFGDVNGDGFADYVMPYTDGGFLKLVSFLGQGSGQFGNGILTQSTNIGLVTDNFGQGTGQLVDVNGDGYDDYVMPYQTNTERICFITFISNKDGTFKVGVASTSTSFGMARDSNNQGVGLFADVTGNGRHDYVMPYVENGRILLATFLADSTGKYSNGTLTISTQFGMVKDNVGQGTGRMADINGDGKMDYVMPYLSDAGRIKFVIFISKGDGTFNEGYVSTSTNIGMVFDNNMQGVGMFGDITGDGRADYVMPYQNNNRIHLVAFTANANSGLSNGTVTISTQYGMTIDNVGQGTGRLIDVNNDGKMDYVMPYQSDAGKIKFVTFISNGDGTFKNGVVTESLNYGMIRDNLNRGTGQFVEN